MARRISSSRKREIGGFKAACRRLGERFPAACVSARVGDKTATLHFTVRDRAGSSCADWLAAIAAEMDAMREFLETEAAFAETERKG